MIYTPLTKKALKLCFEAHKEQLDKSGMAVFGAKIRNETPEAMAGRFQGLRIIAQVLIPGVVGPAIGAAVLKNADTIVNSDGTESFLPSNAIFTAALIVLAVLAAAYAVYLIIRKKHEADLQ